MHPTPSHCPVCGESLTVTRLACPACDTAIEGRFQFSRLDRLSDSSRQLLGVAAAMGQAFSFSVLQEVSEQPAAEVISSLEAWLRRGIVRERTEPDGLAAATPRYDFSHAQIRTVAYNEMNRARRRWVHRRVAEVLAPRRQCRAAATAGARVDETLPGRPGPPPLRDLGDCALFFN